MKKYKNKRTLSIKRMIALGLLLTLVADVSFSSKNVGLAEEKTYPSSGNYTVTVSNNDALKEQGCYVTTSLLDGNQTAQLTVTSYGNGGTHSIDGKFEIFSVRYNGREYYAGTKAQGGLYYEDGWKFQFPEALQSGAVISAQVTFLLTNVSGKSHVNAYSVNTQNVSGSNSSITFDEAGNKAVAQSLSSGLKVSYYDYEGKEQTTTYRSDSSAGLSFDGLQFYVSQVEENNNRSIAKVFYGGSAFTDSLGNENMLYVYSVPMLTATVERQAGTNCLTFPETGENTTKYCYMDDFYLPDEGNYSTSWSGGNSKNPILLNYDWQISGGAIAMPQEGIYLPGAKSTSGTPYHITANFGISAAGQAAVTELSKYVWYGPKSSSVAGSGGTTANITDNLKDVSGSKSDYCGKITKVNNTAVTETTAYKDANITISSKGDIKILKTPSSAMTYEIETTTQYTKLLGNTLREDNEIVEKTIGFANAMGSQTWKVTLTIAATAQEVIKQEQKNEEESSSVSDSTSSSTSNAVSNSTGIAKVTKVKAKQKKGKIILSWKKISGVKGYVIYYKTSKKGSYKKLTTLKKNKKTYTAKVKNKKKTYYYKVRAYKKTSSGKSYGPYSKVVKVKYKKR